MQSVSVVRFARTRMTLAQHAPKVYTKTGMASKVSVVREIAIGLSLGVFCGGLFKVREPMACLSVRGRMRDREDSEKREGGNRWHAIRLCLCQVGGEDFAPYRDI